MIAALAVVTALGACESVGDEVNGPFLAEPPAGGHGLAADPIAEDSGTVWVGFTHAALHAGDAITGTLTVDGARGPAVTIEVPPTATPVTSGSVSFDPPSSGWARGSYRVDVALDGGVFGGVTYSVP